MCLKTRPSRIPWAILVAMAASTASANAFTSLLIGEVPGSGIPGIQTLCDGGLQHAARNFADPFRIDV
jgi:hypothetical protein